MHLSEAARADLQRAMDASKASTYSCLVLACSHAQVEDETLMSRCDEACKALEKACEPLKTKKPRTSK